ncbi:hypermethylated in cancer 1 like [Trichomycterus rosablanca]|uniref:hypermethylated in cancer 1 like n=1 Tax=Trichomycterus rosablanca TaxID=2290929 RepID=UPI002F35B15E
MELSNYASQLLLQLNQQRSKGFLCDVVIMVDNTLFRAHKCVLAATSSYFKSLVLHDNLIHLDAELVDPDVFQKVLDFVYTGKLTEECQEETEPVRNLNAYLTVANYLQLHDLASLCSSKLESRKGTHNGHSSPALNRLIKREAEDASSDIEAYANMVPPKKRLNGENKRSFNKLGFGVDLTRKSSSRYSLINAINSRQEYTLSTISKATAKSFHSEVNGKSCPDKTKGLDGFNGTQDWKTPPKERSRRKANVNGYFPVIKGGSHINLNHKDEQAEENEEQPEIDVSNDASPNFVYRQEYLNPSQEDNQYVCIPCGKGFPSSESLNLHVETHLDADMDPSKDEEDEDLATTKSQEALDISDKSPPLKRYKELVALRPFPCNICGKVFTQRGTMTRHMRSHLGLKPFACDECGMRFTRQYRLTEHMRVHSGEKPYECQVCGGKFTQQRNLISHMRMHTSPT